MRLKRFHVPGAQVLIVWVLGAVTLVQSQGAADWPRFRGPAGDGVCAETGLLQELPEGGPALLWQMEGLGTGYASVTIAGGRLFTVGDLGEGDERSQYALAFDLATRERLWATRMGPPHGDGSRSPQTFEHQETTAFGHHHVENDKIRILAFGQREPLVAVTGNNDFVSA